MSLTHSHREFLHGQAISDEVIKRHGIRSSTSPEDVPDCIDRFFVQGPGIIFDWFVDESRTVPQFRPDTPVIDSKGGSHKYIFPKGCGTFVGVLREPSPSGDDDTPVHLLVEGTKQVHAAASWAPPSWGIRGIAGCNNWVGADLSWSEDARVVVLFDSDLKTNRDVHDAAVELKGALEGMGATEVGFATLTNARSKEGLDDVLGRIPANKRGKYLERMAKAAKASLGRAPKSRKNEHPLFEGSEFLAMKASDAVLEGQPAALGLGSTVALYRDGAFRLDLGKEPLYESLQRLLGDKYRPAWRTTVEESLVGLLSGRGMRLPERQSQPILNVANGMLDLRTGELLPHSPDHLSSLQIPIHWNPRAVAPRYESWVYKHCPYQVEDLEESVSVMLDPSRTPSKAVFLFGVPRSGKSTFLRLVRAVMGSRNTVGVDLHQLSDDPFAAANLYGMGLNVAADVSSAHVQDTSLFKRMTGEDVIQANRKYGAQFAFVNRALFAFSANTLPTVNEASRAYVERIKPFNFPRTFAGAEDPRVEDAVHAELEGILVRWVSAWQRFDTRGRYAESNPEVMRRFETSSNRVSLWVDRTARVHTGAVGRLVGDDEGTGRQPLYEAFRRWLEGEGGAGAMKRSAFLESLESIPGVGEVRLRAHNKNAGLNVTIRPEIEWDKPDEPLFMGTDQPGVGVESVGSVGSQPFPPYVSLTLFPKGLVGEETEREVHGGNGEKVTLPTLSTLPAPDDAFIVAVDTAPRVVAFDVETPDADELLSWDASRGPWARLCGYSIDGAAPVTTTDVSELLTALDEADVITAHNGLNYDLIGLARHHGADYTALALKCDDPLVIARQLDPPSAKKGNARNHYDLDSLGTRMVGAGKHGDLNALKVRHKGYHLIPTDDLEYVAYLKQDVQLLNDLRPLMPVSRYVRDEHAFITACGEMTLRAVKVDVPLVTERAAAEDKQKRDALTTLHETAGLPLERVTERVTVTRKANGKGVGRKAEREAVIAGETSYRAAGDPEGVPVAIDPDDYVIERTRVREVYKSPLGSADGKVWLEGVWDRHLREGTSSSIVPRTDKGQLCTQRDQLQAVIDRQGCPPELANILDLMNTANGARVVYATVLKNMINGRYHPRMSPEQASGRLSCGVSVFGKHGGKVRERAVFVADEGELMVAFDYDQVDARAVAAHCQDPAYMDLFEGDLDFHTANAVLVFGDAKYRQVAKVVGHGENYGMGLKGLVGHVTDATDMTMEAATGHAQAYVDAMERLYPVRNLWRDGVRARADRGELLDNGFGRLMRPEAGRGWTQGPALIGQGTTRDIMRKSILDLPPHVRACLKFTVHDELVFSFPADRIDEYCAAVMEAMTFDWFPAFLPANSRPVHITCGRSKAAESWAGCYQ